VVGEGREEKKGIKGGGGKKGKEEERNRIVGTFKSTSGRERGWILAKNYLSFMFNRFRPRDQSCSDLEKP